VENGKRGTGAQKCANHCGEDVRTSITRGGSLNRRIVTGDQDFRQTLHRPSAKVTDCLCLMRWECKGSEGLRTEMHSSGSGGSCVCGKTERPSRLSGGGDHSARAKRWYVKESELIQKVCVHDAE
jgi:hypothetical protein